MPRVFSDLLKMTSLEIKRGRPRGITARHARLPEITATTRRSRIAECGRLPLPLSTVVVASAGLAQRRLR